MAFNNLKPNQRITFRIPNGLAIKNGKVVQEYKRVSAKVNPMLIFETHVVANYGHFGQVVDSQNFIK